MAKLKKGEDLRHWLLLSLSVAIYLIAACYQLSLPGLHYDEAFEVVPTVQLLKNQPTTPFRESALSLFGKRLPLTTQDYIGALNTYGSLPFLAVGGITVASLRTYALVIGLLTLLLGYGFTADLTHDRSAGLVAAFLLAVNPTFIFWNRQGIFVTAITAAIGLAATWSWLKWWRTKTYRFALLGVFLFGMGLYAKLLFIWLIMALFGAFVVTHLKTLWPCKEYRRAFNLSFQQGVGLLLAGLAGAWPLVLYNLQTSGTFKSITENAGTSYYGSNNSAVLTNLGIRGEQFGTLLNSSHFWYLGQVYTNNVTVVIFSLALIVSLWLTFIDKKTTRLMPFMVIGLVVGQSIVTVSALWITHFALIMVWPAIALAVSGTSIRQHFRSAHLSLSPKRKLINIGLGLFFVFLVATEAKTTFNYHRALTDSGGLSTHSDAIYDLAAWLEGNTDQPNQSVIAMDWGLAAPVIFLTGGQVRPIEVFGYDWATTERFAASITPHLVPERATFLWRAPDEIIFDRSADFKALYRPLAFEENIQAAFYERSGRPIIGATHLVPTGTAENKPIEIEP